MSERLSNAGMSNTKHCAGHRMSSKSQKSVQKNGPIKVRYVARYIRKDKSSDRFECRIFTDVQWT